MIKGLFYECVGKVKNRHIPVIAHLQRGEKCFNIFFADAQKNHLGGELTMKKILALLWLLVILPTPLFAYDEIKFLI